MRMILDAHSQLAVCGELHFYDQMCQLRPELPVFESEGDLDRAARFVRRTVAYRLLESGQEILEKGVDALRKRLPCPFEDLHGALLEACADSGGCEARRRGEKTPANVRYLDEIARSFPDAAFVHMVRDPRAVATSSIEVEGNSSDVVIHALTWRCDVYCARRFARSNPDRLTEVRYEDLVRDPREGVKRLTEFLGLPFEEGMLGFYSRAEEKIEVEREPWKEGATKPIYRSSVDRWKDELEPEQIRLVERAAGRFLGACGYRRWRGDEVSWVSIFRGLAGETRKYVRAKRDSRSPVGSGDGDLVRSDTSVLRGLLLRSLFDRSPSSRGAEGRPSPS